MCVCVCMATYYAHVCIDRDSWALNRSRLLDKSMRQWGGHHLPCYSAERTPIHVLRTHLSLCVWVLVNICLLSICQLVFMDPAADLSMVHFVAIRTEALSSNPLFVWSTMALFWPSTSPTLSINFTFFSIWYDYYYEKCLQTSVPKQRRYLGLF